MMQLESSTVLLSLAVALSSVACQGDTPHPSATSSVTSAQVAAPAQPTTMLDDDLVCEIPNDEPMGAAVVPAPSPRVSAAKASARSFVAAPVAPVRAKSTDSLGVAMAQAVNEGGDSGTPEPVEPVTMTSTTVPAPPVPAAPLAPASAPASVLFDNRLPGNYQLERVRMSIDGVPSYSAPSVGTMQVPPGDHLVEVIADYRLRDPVFSYVDGYHIELRTTRVVPASSTPSSFVAAAMPSGGVTTPFEKRAALAWHHVL
jgi:hypothetical protein